MDALLQDLRYATRTFAHRPGFTLAAVLTIALGTGAATALFSVVNGLLLEPLPLREPERLVEVVPQREGTFAQTHDVSYQQFTAMHDAQTTLDGLAAIDVGAVNLESGARIEEVDIGYVSGNYFGLLGVQPALGRLIRVEDDRRGAATAGVVLSHRFWRTRFG